jgi:hypothetical protein
MNGQEYLDLIEDLTKEFAEKCAPHGEWMRNAILEAEVRFAEAINTPPKYLDKVSKMGRNGEMLRGYLYKWRDQLIKEVTQIERDYAELIQPLLDEHEFKIAERLVSNSSI